MATFNSASRASVKGSQSMRFAMRGLLRVVRYAPISDLGQPIPDVISSTDCGRAVHVTVIRAACASEVCIPRKGSGCSIAPKFTCKERDGYIIVSSLT
jgi:hypothetical protein